jgi:uncharacterized protein YjeT (DUF2065 family)
MDYFISVLGLALVLEGIPYFIFPGHLKKMLAKFALMPAEKLRFIGVISIACGLIVLGIGRIVRNY